MISKKGAELEVHYATLLRELSTQKGILGQIFVKSQNKIQDPAMLAKVIDMINSENWLVMGADVKGDIYEGLLELDAEENKKLTGQVFLPRPLMVAMTQCLNIEPKKKSLIRIVEPADYLLLLIKRSPKKSRSRSKSIFEIPNF